MNWVKTIGTIFLCLNSLGVFRAQAQMASEVTPFESLMDVPDRTAHYHYAQQDNDAELKLLFSGLFLLYKQFISSQDGQHCSFTPSCSEYAIQGIKKKGLVTGLLGAFDRLTRCNNLSPELYERHPETHLLYDPVE